MTIRDATVLVVGAGYPGKRRAYERMAALGAQIADLARHASLWNAVLLGLAILAWIALCLGVQFLVTWMAGRRP